MRIYRFIVKGKVQGVYYRKTIASKMNHLNIAGYVKNLPNGDVEVVLEIPEDGLISIKNILKEGSRRSIVESIEEADIRGDMKLSKDFEIKY
jgi:acylphosphatase